MSSRATRSQVSSGTARVMYVCRKTLSQKGRGLLGGSVGKNVLCEFDGIN